jgi:cobalamin biosynthesis protein CobC
MDRSWLAETVERLHDEANRLDRLLQAAGFDVIGGTSLFRLARHDGVAMWFERLCQAGILTRPFRTNPHWLRFGVPHAQAEWERLQAGLMNGRSY